MFYEIPVARPWTERSEHRAYQEVVEQVRLGDKVGFHSVWTVEHHFLEEFSHCSNPEVLYGHLAAVTENLRLGYGVRLMPKPYNHPVRTAESVAVLDLLSNGRVELGTGRSATRAELEGFGIHPGETRAMWREALEMTVAAMTRDKLQWDGHYWQMPSRRVLPSRCSRPTPRCGPPPAPTAGIAWSARRVWGCCRSRWAHLPRSWPGESPSTGRESRRAPTPSGGS